MISSSLKFTLEKVFRKSVPLAMESFSICLHFPIEETHEITPTIFLKCTLLGEVLLTFQCLSPKSSLRVRKIPITWESKRRIGLEQNFKIHSTSSSLIHEKEYVKFGGNVPRHPTYSACMKLWIVACYIHIYAYDVYTKYMVWHIKCAYMHIFMSIHI